MSLGSDYLAEYAFERDYPHGVNGDEWRDARGVVHKLKDMSESYIKNVMRFIGKDDDFWYACEADALYKATDIYNVIKSAPTADVVEVVRCKDCKYWQDNNDGYPHQECRWGNYETPDPDDYCSYGELKDGDTE